MSRRPTIEVWMPLHFADITKACARLGDLGELYFLRLLRDQWLNGPTPDDDAALANVAGVSIAKWRSVRKQLAQHFTVTDGVWCHEATQARRNHALGVSQAKKRGQQRCADGAQMRPKCDPNADIRDLGSSSVISVGSNPSQEVSTEVLDVAQAANVIPMAGKGGR